MVELADTTDLKSVSRKRVRVRVPLLIFLKMEYNGELTWTENLSF